MEYKLYEYTKLRYYMKIQDKEKYMKTYTTLRVIRLRKYIELFGATGKIMKLEKLVLLSIVF